MLNNPQILIKDSHGQLKVAQVSANTNNNPANNSGPQPVRTTINISSGTSNAGPGINPAVNASQSDHTEGANFYFSTEDEEEIKQIKKDKPRMTQQQLFNIIRAYAQAVVDKSMLDLDDNLKQRLIRIVESRLRDIRDLIETKETLVREVNLGGLGLDTHEANNVIKLIEDERSQIEDLVAKTKDYEKVAAQLMANPPLQSQSSSRSIVPPHAPQVDSKNPTISNIPTRPSLVQAPVMPVSDQSNQLKNQPTIDQINIQALSINSTSKPSIETSQMNSQDIIRPKPKAKVLGPIDELEEMTINEFRNLSDKPQISADKIMQKLDLLEDESIEEKYKGLVAWRKSPIYKLYLDIGQKSIEAGKSVEVYLKEVADKSENLTFEEFEVIADLNKRLSF